MANLSKPARLMLLRCSAAEKVSGERPGPVTAEEQHALLATIADQKAALDELAAAALVEWRGWWRLTSAGRRLTKAPGGRGE